MDYTTKLLVCYNEEWLNLASKPLDEKNQVDMSCMLSRTGSREVSYSLANGFGGGSVASQVLATDSYLFLFSKKGKQIIEPRKFGQLSHVEFQKLKVKWNSL